MSDAILSPTFLFRFSTPCHRIDDAWTDSGMRLAEAYSMPCFAELEGRDSFGEFRAGWNADGLYFELTVGGKEKPLWCRSTRIDDSDGLHLWIDCRDTHNIHRASRFCHRFAFLPSGGGPGKQSPLGRLLPINRARENPKSIADDALKVTSQIADNGYTIQAHVPATALTGFDPAEHPRLGFFFAVYDHQLGWQTFSVGSEFPFAEDPSLWGSLELVD